MTWPRIDDNVADHPKMLHAESLYPDFAWVLWSRALLYTNKHRLDGRVPGHVLSSFVASKKVRVRDIAEALVVAGLWERDGDDYVFHDFASWNLTKSAREEAARANREKQQRYRDRHREPPPPEPSNRLANPDVTGYATVSNRTRDGNAEVSNGDEDGHETGDAPVRDPSDNQAMPEVSLAHARAGARAPSHPIPSHPIPSLSEPPPSGEREAGEDPTEGELFAAYAQGVTEVVGYLSKPIRDDRNAHALSTVWGQFGYGKTTRESFLRTLTRNAASYVRAAMDRKQPAQFEANYAPYRFLAWLQAHEAGHDPWPTRANSGAREGRGGGAGRGPAGGRPVQSMPPLDPAAARLLGRVGGGDR